MYPKSTVIECGTQKRCWPTLVPVQEILFHISQYRAQGALCHSPSDDAGCSTVTFSASVWSITRYVVWQEAIKREIQTLLYNLQFSRLRTINSAYLDGFSGSPRQHVWTYAVGINENRGTSPNIFFVHGWYFRPICLSRYIYRQSLNGEHFKRTITLMIPCE